MSIVSLLGAIIAFYHFGIEQGFFDESVVCETKKLNQILSKEDLLKQLKQNKHNEWMPLKGNGDFRSEECISLLKLSDIVVTNPPFSLFIPYVKQLFKYKKSDSLRESRWKYGSSMTIF